MRSRKICASSVPRSETVPPDSDSVPDALDRSTQPGVAHLANHRQVGQVRDDACGRRRGAHQVARPGLGDRRIVVV